jgi:hypothetical protein
MFVSHAWGCKALDVFAWILPTRKTPNAKRSFGLTPLSTTSMVQALCPLNAFAQPSKITSLSSTPFCKHGVIQSGSKRGESGADHSTTTQGISADFDVVINAQAHERASAFQPEDRDNIFGAIEESAGGFQRVNVAVNTAEAVVPVLGHRRSVGRG